LDALPDDGDEEAEGDDALARECPPEKGKKKLLDAKAWDRDGRLVEVVAPRRWARSPRKSHFSARASPYHNSTMQFDWRRIEFSVFARKK
jgi:hypothetical protein